MTSQEVSNVNTICFIHGFVFQSKFWRILDIFLPTPMAVYSIAFGFRDIGSLQQVPTSREFAKYCSECPLEQNSVDNYKQFIKNIDSEHYLQLPQKFGGKLISLIFACR